MTDQSIKPVSIATGTFPILQTGQFQAVKSGNPKPASGNQVPLSEPQRSDPDALAAKLNVASQSLGRDLRFKIDVQSGQSVIQVLDSDTGELIREIPPEKADISLSLSGDIELSLYSGRA